MKKFFLAFIGVLGLLVLALFLSGEVQLYRGSLYRLQKSVLAKVTAYCPCNRCCPGTDDNITSLGDNAKVCDGVAVDPKLIAYRSVISVPGVGLREADDTGGAMRQNGRQGQYHIDVRMTDHDTARHWGVKELKIGIYAALFAPAQKTQAPRSVPPTHRVERGENLSVIAQKYGLIWQTLASVNHLKDPDKIQPGQIIKLK
jgi:3D (Asp-Asp-Asp) domain-containing protein